VKFRYMAVHTKKPVPSLAGQQVRFRSVLGVELVGAGTPQLRDGLLDTGADDTVVSDALAIVLGVDLSHAEQRSIALAGRPQPVLCRYSSLLIRISNGTEVFEWPATVGFVSARLHYALLGQAGFLQFFSADFDGESHADTQAVLSGPLLYLLVFASVAVFLPRFGCLPDGFLQSHVAEPLDFGCAQLGVVVLQRFRQGRASEGCWHVLLLLV
jgi:hypothetical protein